MLKPEELTLSIEVWMEKLEAYKVNSVFNTQGEVAKVAYLKNCVYREILSAVPYKTAEMEKELFKRIRNDLRE